MSNLFAQADPEMKIGALAPWFGGKRTLAPRIVAELGSHSAYWEPFCGGMPVLLAKPESSHETVNDLHRDLINLARVIQDDVAGAKLYRRLRRVLCDEHVRDEVLSLPESDDPIERAYRYFVSSWLGRNGFSGTTSEHRSSFAVRWTPNGGHGGQRFQSAVSSIPGWRRRMRRVVILNRDGFDVLANIDDHPKVAIYCDPPYIVKNGEYAHDFNGGDHERLAGALRRFKNARVVVSYYAHPSLADLYSGWTFVDCSMAKGLHNAGLRGKRAAVAPEVLLINGESFTATRERAQ